MEGNRECLRSLALRQGKASLLNKRKGRQTRTTPAAGLVQSGDVGHCEGTGWHWTLGPGWGPGLPQGRPVHSAPGPHVAPELGGVETRGTSLRPPRPTCGAGLGLGEHVSSPVLAAG